MKLKALVLAAAIAASGSAFALPQTQTNFTVVPGQVTFAGFNVGSSFSDTYTFSASGLGTAAVNAFATSFGLISNFSATLNGTPLQTFSVPGAFNAVFGSGVANTFSLVVSGTGNGLYAGSFSISAVPEPGSLALMLAGLGVVGFVAARRRKAD